MPIETITLQKKAEPKVYELCCVRIKRAMPTGSFHAGKRSRVLTELSYSVVSSWGLSDVALPARSVTNNDPHRGSAWTSHHREGCGLVLQLEQPSVVSAVMVLNNTVSRVNLSVAEKNQRRSWVDTCRGVRTRHNAWIELRPGSLPCRYIKIECLKGTPVSIQSIKVMGIPGQSMHVALGPGYQALLVRKPLESLFGTSLEASLEDKVYAPQLPRARRR